MSTNKIRSIDINCDLGESTNQNNWQKDVTILPFISSANIACGGHAGNKDSMAFMIRHCLEQNVKVGAHPSYPDRENFGRVAMDISSHDLRQSLRKQLQEFLSVCEKLNTHIFHIKPHGALYNQAAIDLELAILIAEEIKSLDSSIKFMGLAHSKMELAANKIGIEFISEAFMDRFYHDNKTLVSRKDPKAVHTDVATCLEQALKLAQFQPINTFEQSQIRIQAGSICLHGDNENAAEIAKSLKNHLSNNQITIQ